MLQHNTRTTFEFEDRHIIRFSSNASLRGLRHEGKRPFYVTIEAMASKEYMAKDIKKIRHYFFLDVLNAMQPGPLKGRIMIKPKWLYDAILQNKDI